MQRQTTGRISTRRMLDVVYRLSRLLVGGTDSLSFLRAILQAALAFTGSHRGGVLILERDQRALRPVVCTGDAAWAETGMPVDEPPWSDEPSNTLRLRATHGASQTYTQRPRDVWHLHDPGWLSGSRGISWRWYGSVQAHRSDTTQCVISAPHKAAPKLRPIDPCASLEISLLP